MELTIEEKQAIASLKRLAKRWPSSLWLFSASGTLCVMKTDENGTRVHRRDGEFDVDFMVDEIRGISNDGGDW